MITPLYAFYQARFGFSGVALTIVYAAYVIGNLVALLFLGRLSDASGDGRSPAPPSACARSPPSSS